MKREPPADESGFAQGAISSVALLAPTLATHTQSLAHQPTSRTCGGRGRDQTWSDMVAPPPLESMTMKPGQASSAFLVAVLSILAGCGPKERSELETRCCGETRIVVSEDRTRLRIELSANTVIRGVQTEHERIPGGLQTSTNLREAVVRLVAPQPIAYDDWPVEVCEIEAPPRTAWKTINQAWIRSRVATEFFTTGSSASVRMRSLPDTKFPPQGTPTQRAIRIHLSAERADNNGALTTYLRLSTEWVFLRGQEIWKAWTPEQARAEAVGDGHQLLYASSKEERRRTWADIDSALRDRVRTSEKPVGIVFIKPWDSEVPYREVLEAIRCLRRVGAILVEIWGE